MKIKFYVHIWFCLYLRSCLCYNFNESPKMVKAKNQQYVERKEMGSVNLIK